MEFDIETAAKDLFTETVKGFADKGKKFVVASGPAGLRAARAVVESQVGGLLGVKPSAQRVKEANAVIANIKSAGEIEFLNAMNDAAENFLKRVVGLAKSVLGL